MKVKTSVTLSPGVLLALDRFRGNSMARSRAIEQLVQESLDRRERAARSEREIAILNAIADGKFGEKPDVLEGSIPWWELGSEFTDEEGRIVPVERDATPRSSELPDLRDR